ncbi:alpha-1,2-fucosyltransferase [Clostridium perfringens]|uniref:alpha-1,2-fucosyltransferase n=1 Tax=Clostridium perfringens TaxID=1502 RepID=UPI000F8D4937|nr:alpha-1,2-fucosyltransferase [Clostridium perfringens]RUR38708.1 alpha-1,2-fucosyltransferase [Clostridium perfringens]
MVILKVIGGLGNQMFEVAFARMLALEFNEKIYLDCSVYDKYKIRNFSLSHLNISEYIDYIENANLKKYEKIYLKISQKIYHIYQKFIKIIKNNDRIGEEPYKLLMKYGLIYNFDVYYYNFINNNNKIKCLYGYFQSEKYFKKYKNNIIKELKVKTNATELERELIEEIKKNNSVGVSIRLGDDYINSSELNVCNKEFYYKGMDYIYNKNKDSIFYIFSDDVDRVKNLFEFKYPVKFIEGFKDYQSLRLLYSCKNFIISNSSFSWWGAYLSENKDKLIVAPSKWYNSSKERPDIYYEEMITINI